MNIDNYASVHRRSVGWLEGWEGKGEGEAKHIVHHCGYKGTKKTVDHPTTFSKNLHLNTGDCIKRETYEGLHVYDFC